MSYQRNESSRRLWQEEDFQETGATPGGREMDWRAIAYAALDKWWLIAICVALAWVGVSIYLSRAERIYAATAVIKFDADTPRSLGSSDPAEDLRSDEQRKERLKDIQFVLQSAPLLRRVVASNHLDTDRRFVASAITSPAERDRLISKLAHSIRVTPRGGTTFIDVTVEHHNPQLAAQLANSLVEELSHMNSDSYRTASRSSGLLLVEETQDLQRTLADPKFGTKLERSQLESALSTNTERLLALPRIATDPTVVTIRSSIAQQEVELANLRQVYLARHPVYIQAESKLAELRQALANAALRAAQTMQVAYEDGVDREGRSVQIFQSATVPKSPAKPRAGLLLLGGLLGGIGLGILLVLGSELFDDSFKTLNETEGVLKLPVLSTVPRLPARTNGERIVMEDDSPLSGAEAFRALRTSLFLLDPGGKDRSFLVTSTLAGEGKTFCTVNYAVSLARQGLRTLVIDCDLRRPVLEEVIWGERKNLPGLADYLNGEELTVHETRFENLYFVPAGTAAANASESLARVGLQDLLKKVLREFDRVVVDSAPIFGVSDTLRLVKEVDAVCLVVLAGKTPRKLATRCLQLLSRAGAPVAGIILNAVRDSLRSSYGNPFYDYGYAVEPRKRRPRVLLKAAKPDLRPNHDLAES